MKRTFQKGNRLWSVESAGKRVTTTWGVAGGKTQSKSFAHDDPIGAAAFVQAQPRQKLQAGYVETTFRGELPLSDTTAQVSSRRSPRIPTTSPPTWPSPIGSASRPTTG